MTKSILAYFKSENDVESARIRLQSLRVEKVFADSIPEDGDEMSFIPVLPTSTGSFSPGVAAVIPPEQEEVDDDDVGVDRGKMTHLIEVEVRDEDYEKAMKIIQESHGYKDSSIE